MLSCDSSYGYSSIRYVLYGWNFGLQLVLVFNDIGSDVSKKKILQTKIQPVISVHLWSQFWSADSILNFPTCVWKKGFDMQKRWFMDGIGECC